MGSNIHLFLFSIIKFFKRFSPYLIDLHRLYHVILSQLSTKYATFLI